MEPWNRPAHLILFYFLLIHYTVARGQHKLDIKADKPPNIVFILMDDLGWGDVGYHNPEVVTPTIDSLARKGVRLENYYVQPLCTPSRNQLLSGRHEIYTGLQHSVIVHDQALGMPLELPTLADALRDRGYATHAVGKWHLGFFKKEYTPTYRGFDTFYGCYGGFESYFTHIGIIPCYRGRCSGYDFRYDRYKNSFVNFHDMGRYSTTLFADRAVNIIRRHDNKKPLFLYLSPNAVHTPLDAPAYAKLRFQHVQDRTKRTYLAMVYVVDEMVANVTKALEDADLMDNTVLIFSADNGGNVSTGASNGPYRSDKNSFYEGGVKGAGFVYSKLLKQHAVINKGMIHIADWFPTLLRLAGGIRSKYNLDGYDVWDVISQGHSSPRQEILHGLDPLEIRLGIPLYNDTFDTSIRASLRLGPWKIITGNPHGSFRATHGRNVLLYNIYKDPYEKKDISRRFPGVVRMLLARLNVYYVKSVPVRYPEGDPLSDPLLHGGVWGPWR